MQIISGRAGLRCYLLDFRFRFAKTILVVFNVLVPCLKKEKLLKRVNVHEVSSTLPIVALPSFWRTWDIFRNKTALFSRTIQSVTRTFIQRTIDTLELSIIGVSCWASFHSTRGSLDIGGEITFRRMILDDFSS